MINNLYIKATPTTAAVTWGSITGTLSAQTDLQSALNAKQATLVSGTNIKTLEGQSLLGSGNIDLTKSDVGLANVDNTSDLNKPISTATQTALNAKENTITAGTTAQYYRGDKTFQTLDKTAVGLANVDNTSDLNKPISTATQTALNAKQNTLTLTTTGTSGAATLVGATLNIPQYSSGAGGGGGGLHIPTKPITGFAYTNAIALGTNIWGIGSNNTYLSLFIPINTITVSALSVECTTAGAGAAIKILIYSDVNGKPTSKLIQSTNLDFSTTGKKTFTTSYTFTAGTTYWVGYIGNSFSGAMRSFTEATPFATSETGISIYPLWSFNDSFATPSATLTATSSNLSSAQNTPKINFISV